MPRVALVSDRIRGFEREPDAGVAAGVALVDGHREPQCFGVEGDAGLSRVSRTAAATMLSPCSRCPEGEARGFRDSRTPIGENPHHD
jgi:hypothetical protein